MILVSKVTRGLFLLLALLSSVCSKSNGGFKGSLNGNSEEITETLKHETLETKC